MRRHGTTIQRKCNLTPETNNLVNLALADPKRNKIKYGAFSHLVEHLLIRWINDVKNMNKDIIDDRTSPIPAERTGTEE